MNTFEDRTKGFEAKFKQDADLQFKLSAKRNKLIGEWQVKYYKKKIKKNMLKK